MTCEYSFQYAKAALELVNCMQLYCCNDIDEKERSKYNGIAQPGEKTKTNLEQSRYKVISCMNNSCQTALQQTIAALIERNKYEIKMRKNVGLESKGIDNTNKELSKISKKKVFGTDDLNKLSLILRLYDPVTSIL